MQGEMKERKVAVIKVSPELIGELCRNGEKTIRIESGVPEDASVKAVYFDDRTGVFNVYFESESFAAVPLGLEAPQLEPVVYTVNNKGGA